MPVDGNEQRNGDGRIARRSFPRKPRPNGRSVRAGLDRGFGFRFGLRFPFRYALLFEDHKQPGNGSAVLRAQELLFQARHL